MCKFWWKYTNGKNCPKHGSCRSKLKFYNDDIVGIHTRTSCKYNYMWTWIFQTKICEEFSHKSFETWSIWCIDASVIMWSSDGKYGLG